MTAWEPISLDAVKSYSLKARDSKVKTDQFGAAWRPGKSMKQWLGSLPNILAGQDFREVVECVVQASAKAKSVLLGMGAHGIKVGLNPIIVHLLEKGIISGIAMNGACVIHDAEVAMVGHTSEDVAAELGTGRFGMAEETGAFINTAISKGAQEGWGLGRSVGAELSGAGYAHNEMSILAKAYDLGIPVTVHVAIGTDIVHFHPQVDGSAVGQTSHMDFRIFARLVSNLEQGVFINLGSAVIIPEVFLKALSLVRNLGYEVENITTVNMDFIRHYRPMTNVVQRPTMEGGKGYSLVGHHEIMFPLLAAAVLEGLNELDV
jgi:deoxyhypusine synthase